MQAGAAGVAGEAAGAVKDREGAIRVVVDPHLGAQIVRPDRARRDLPLPAKRPECSMPSCANARRKPWSRTRCSWKCLTVKPL